MAIYVPRMEKARNTFISDAKNGLDNVFQWCTEFEFNLNLVSYSFVKSISRLSQSFEHQASDQELIQIVNSFNSFLKTIENDFNLQLEIIIKNYHSLKNDFALHIEKDLDIINEGIKQTLIFQMNYKKSQKSFSQSPNLNFLLYVKDKIKLFRDEIENVRNEISRIQNIFSSTLAKYKERNAKTLNSMRNETKYFNNQREDFEKQINEAKNKPKFKANTNDNNNYYLLINNIENDTEMINKLKLEYEKEIRELKKKNGEEEKKYIDSFKEIHDKICKNMDETKLLHEELNKIRVLNEKEEAETRSFYISEQKKFQEENQKFFLIKNEIEEIINDFNKENELEYIRQRDESKRKIEIERQNEEIEFKELEKFLFERNQKILNDLISAHESTCIQSRIEREYENKYNEYLQQLSSPVFSTAIGYQKSDDVTNLLARKDSILSNISNERNFMITKSKSEIVPKKSILKYQSMKPKNFIQICAEEKNLLKKLYSDQIESNNAIRRKEKESKNEIRKLKKDLSTTRRVYFTKKLYLMDALSSSLDYSSLADNLKNDENNDKQIENLEDKIFFQMNLFESKSNLNHKKVKQLENELDRLNESLARLLDKYARVKKQLLIQKNDKLTNLVQSPKSEKVKSIMRAKSSQSPNLISPMSSKYAKQKRNLTKPA